MDISDVLAGVWPEWRIVKRIGAGSFGVVYEAARSDHRVESHAAIKVISIPQRNEEITSLQAEGLTMEAARNYFQKVVDDFTEEIRLMESFKGIQNIVSVEDYKVVKREEGIGWDICIRMELLTPFSQYICGKVLTEEEVIKFGCDICTALEYCAKRNVIHRDIKPENIFVNSFGDFKLGDFGIARQLENKTGFLSQKGTYGYLAPEVEKGMEYDATVDIYALGLVLYRLLNDNRLPFLKTEQQLIDQNERARAIRRRLNGETLPLPLHASPSMAALIQRACAYDPKKRFPTAAEMKTALLAVLDKREAEKETETRREKTPVSEETVLLPENRRQKANRRKNWKIKVAAIGLALCVLGGGAVWGYIKVEEGKKVQQLLAQASSLAESDDYLSAIALLEASNLTSRKIDETEKGYKEELKNQYLDQADQAADTGDYLSAIEKVNEYLTLMGEDEVLTAKIHTYETNYVQDVLSAVEEMKKQKAYQEATALLDEAAQVCPDNTEIVLRKETIEQLRIENERQERKAQLLQSAEEAFQTIGYEEAVRILQEDAEFANEEDVQAKIEEYKTYMPVTITQLIEQNAIFAKNTSMLYRDKYLVTNYGEEYQTSFSVDKGYVSLLVKDRNFTKFTGVVALPKEASPSGYRDSAQVKIYLDDSLVFTSEEISAESQPQPFEIDVTGVEVVKMEWKCQGANIWSNWGYYATIFDGKFQK